jgi:hypothetical protein
MQRRSGRTVESMKRGMHGERSMNDSWTGHFIHHAPHFFSSLPLSSYPPTAQYLPNRDPRMYKTHHKTIKHIHD